MATNDNATLTLSDAVRAVIDGADSDETYDTVFPPHVRPGQFAHRVQDKALLPGEDSGDFDKCYPDYVTRHQFRELVKMKRSREATPEPVKAADVVSDNAQDGEVPAE